MFLQGYTLKKVTDDHVNLLRYYMLSSMRHAVRWHEFLLEARIELEYSFYGPPK